MRCSTTGVSGSRGLMSLPLASIARTSLQPGMTPPRSAAPSRAGNEVPRYVPPPSFTLSAQEAWAGAADSVAAKNTAKTRSERLTIRRFAPARAGGTRTIGQIRRLPHKRKKPPALTLQTQQGPLVTEEVRLEHLLGTSPRRRRRRRRRRARRADALQRRQPRGGRLHRPRGARRRPRRAHG